MNNKMNWTKVFRMVKSLSSMRRLGVGVISQRGLPKKNENDGRVAFHSLGWKYLIATSLCVTALLILGMCGHVILDDAASAPVISSSTAYEVDSNANDLTCLSAKRTGCSKGSQ